MDGLLARGERTKNQIPNTKLHRNPKLQIPKPGADSLPWSLGLGAYLEFGVWSFNWRKDFPLSPLLRRGEREKTVRRSRSPHSVDHPTDSSVRRLLRSRESALP